MNRAYTQGQNAQGQERAMPSQYEQNLLRQRVQEQSEPTVPRRSRFRVSTQALGRMAKWHGKLLLVLLLSGCAAQHYESWGGSLLCLGACAFHQVEDRSIFSDPTQSREENDDAGTQ